MKYSVYFRPEAQNDILETIQWYEDRLSGLGDEFSISLENEINKICKNPKFFELKHKEIRQAIIRKFPYFIFFKITSVNTITIFAVLHMKRNPKIPKKRFKL